jgi:hypothetical protein
MLVAGDNIIHQPTRAMRCQKEGWEMGTGLGISTDTIVMFPELPRDVLADSEYFFRWLLSQQVDT